MERLGAAVADADAYAHEALLPGTRSYREVARLFGPAVIGRDGRIDRRQVARKVANNARLRTALERIIHPIVIRRLRAWVKRTVRRGRHAVAVVPLLYEVGMTEGWDAVVCVAASRATVLRRLAARGMSAAEARAWIRAQMPVSEKVKKADYVIWNDGSLKLLERRTRAVWKEVVKRSSAS